MADIKQRVGSNTAVTVTGLATLASTAFVASAVVNNTTNDPLDLLMQLSVTPGTVSSNRQVILYAQASYDGTTFTTGPTSGTTATDEPNLTLIGVVPCNTNATAQRGQFSVAGAFGGVLPPYLRFVIKNETGAALTAGELAVAEVFGEVA